MNDQQALIEHLKLIQGVVDRLARNSFAIKATASATSAALVAVIVTQGDALTGAAGVAILALWGLDAYYLSRERAYRALYDRVRLRRSDLERVPEDFMSLRYEVSFVDALRAAFSQSLYLFYPALIAVITTVSAIAA